MLITGMIQLPGMPTPPAATAVPRNVPVQLKNRLWTVESTNVTSHSTRMNGMLSSLHRFEPGELGRAGCRPASAACAAASG